LPHSDFGDPDCCGCLNGVIRGDQADIVCNECGTVLRTVPAANVGQTLTELEITLEVASEMCSHRGSMNLFPGFSKMIAFILAVRKGRSASGLVCRAGRAAAARGYTDPPAVGDESARSTFIPIRLETVRTAEYAILPFRRNQLCFALSCGLWKIHRYDDVCHPV
jgi:hypothetical protein